MDLDLVPQDINYFKFIKGDKYHSTKGNTIIYPVLYLKKRKDGIAQMK